MVSYLNTVPLIWGAIHGAQRDQMNVEFHLPSICADKVRSEAADVGILPVIEIARQRLEIFPGIGIASHGAVRSILIISKVPFGNIKTLACDHGSRTSVMLARLILREQFGATPLLLPPTAPQLDEMLRSADAALVIGDPALAINLETLPYEWLDLGHQWHLLTGLPMVFAVWAAAAKWITPELERDFSDSLAFGLSEMDRIVHEQSIERGFAEAVVRQYLTKSIVFRLGPKDYEGMKTFLHLASAIEPGLKCPIREDALA